MATPPNLLNHPSSSDAQTPGFFQVFLPDHNSHKLRIPQDFIKHFKETIPEKVTLKDLGGNCWHAYMEKAENGLFINNGWENFVRDKSIEVGSFFVFKYDESSSSFTITIFGRNGCNREEDFVCVKVEEKSEEEPKQNYLKRIPLRPETSKGGGAASQRKSPKTSSTGDEKHKVFKSAEQVSPKNPSFCAYICPSKPYALNIPKAVLTKHQIKLKQKMNLRDQNGKIWPIACNMQSDGRIIISRLSTFMNQNKVKIEKQKLIFEFVLDKGSECHEFKVHISKIK